MKGLIWNCRGLGSSDKGSHIRELISEQKIDFLGIQETQLQDFRDTWQVFCWHFLPSNGRSGVLLLGVKSTDMEVCNVECGQHFLLAQIKLKDSGIIWVLVVIYGPAQPAGKEFFLRELAQLCSRIKNPTCIGGDFNLLGMKMRKALGDLAINGVFSSMQSLKLIT